jgi:hypothetical protein
MALLSQLGNIEVPVSFLLDVKSLVQKQLYRLDSDERYYKANVTDEEKLKKKLAFIEGERAELQRIADIIG